MKVIICGAGQVGQTLEHYLAQDGHDVVMVDQDREVLRELETREDVQLICGRASLPEVLKRAGAENADVLIAVTQSDEMNMVICQVAYSLFHVPTKIARIRTQDYLKPEWRGLFSDDNLPVDFAISPETEVAEAIARSIAVPGALETVPLPLGGLIAIGAKCAAQSPMMHVPIKQLNSLFPKLNLSILLILRDGAPFVPTLEDYLLVGDEVYFVVPNAEVDAAVEAFGYMRAAQRGAVLFGGGNVGLDLARVLLPKMPSIQIVERSEARAEYIAQELPDAHVICGDVLDKNLLRELEFKEGATVAAVTNDNETNILSALLVHREFGRGVRTISLVTNPTYQSLIPTLDIDVAVDPREVTVSSVLRHIRSKHFHFVYALHAGFGELVQAVVQKGCIAAGLPVRELMRPGEVVVAAIVRGDEIITYTAAETIQLNDVIVFFARTQEMRRLARLFALEGEVDA